MSPSNLHEYALKPQYDKIPSDEYERPPSHVPQPLQGRMAGPNLSRMGAIPVMIPAQNRDGSICRRKGAASGTWPPFRSVRKASLPLLLQANYKQ
ncbi:hypothetical protein SKAU_G00328640 [Synaphobranchus kaupii]|uniref:Uncharacterized protein n=1 Tax=Synaphobranchus kaupii TaxID=118154 RepID=A0A9Q1EQB4_SYNKA|nr:hypothetical protein SKAU_G00328640 [Synaphobranchus kaupii]